MIKPFICLAVLLSSIVVPGSAQSNRDLPVVYAEGGQGTRVDYRKKGSRHDEEGPYADSYFTNGCDHGNIALRATKASSTLSPQGKNSYTIKNLTDYSPLTAWVEGVEGYGIGSFFEVVCNNVNTIFNGYQSSPQNWLKNSRVKTFKIYMDNRPLCLLQLTDEMGEQRFELPIENDWDASHLFRFEILDVYPGSTWDDVCISEIGNQGCCILASTFDQYATDNTVMGYDQTTNAFETATIDQLTTRIHFTLLDIQAGDNRIQITEDHPLFIQGFGPMSLLQLKSICQTSSYDALAADGVYVLCGDAKNKPIYTRIETIRIIKGRFNTKTIRALNRGESYLMSGFLHPVRNIQKSN